jgi:hypothetical protein
VHRAIVIVAQRVLLWKVIQDSVDIGLSRCHKVDDIAHWKALAWESKLLNLVDAARLHKVKHAAEV